MNNNDIVRRIRYIFDFSDTQMIEIFALAEKKVNRAEISNWMKKEEDENFNTLHDIDLAIFLNGFIILKRGKKDGQVPSPEKKMNNNIVFRKIKIALNLRDEDILELFSLVNLNVGKHELSAIFRNPSQSQFRPCKDQFLRNFLQGLQVKMRSGL